MRSLARPAGGDSKDYRARHAYRPRRAPPSRASLGSREATPTFIPGRMSKRRRRLLLPLLQSLLGASGLFSFWAVAVKLRDVFFLCGLIDIAVRCHVCKVRRARWAFPQQTVDLFRWVLCPVFGCPSYSFQRNVNTPFSSAQASVMGFGLQTGFYACHAIQVG